MAYPLDIVLNAPGKIFVRGRGLDAELGGRLLLKGTTANVLPNGQFSLVRGRLDLLTQRFELDEGSALLVGNFDPSLRLVARTTKNDTTISIIVSGLASSPDVSFESSPTMPEEEVLALLIFDKSLTNLSAFQAVQLASAVATLAGKGGVGTLEKLRRNFGLDDLDITTEDDGTAAVRAGKYISENIYSDVTVRGDGEAELNLNLDLSKTVTVKAGQRSGGGSSLGVFFEKDY
jgi:translocation and assembly module TamB